MISMKSGWKPISIQGGGGDIKKIAYPYFVLDSSLDINYSKQPAKASDQKEKSLEFYRDYV